MLTVTRRRFGWPASRKGDEAAAGEAADALAEAAAEAGPRAEMTAASPPNVEWCGDVPNSIGIPLSVVATNAWSAV